MATDWLKDYDPLFDLFDEEMRGNDGQTTASSNFHPNCLTSTTTTTCNGADYFNEIGADLNSNQYCYNPFKQTDELSLILGLEWMPLGLDLNSPASTSSTYSSNSSAASSTSAYSSPNSSTTINSNNNNNSSGSSSSSNHNINNRSNNISNKNNSSNSNKDTGGSVIRGSGATVAATTASMNYIVTNGSSSPLKKKKKNIKPRGTSLLAQPSPKTSKLIINSNNTTPTLTTPTISLTPVRQINTTSRPLSTLLTINKQQTNISTAVNTSSTRSPHHHHLLSLPHTNMTSNITFYSSLCPNSQQVLRKQNVTNTTNANIISTNTVGYCVKIEHAYSR